MVKQPTIVNATSHQPTVILLVLNLVATIALLAHVVYYIPSSINAAASRSPVGVADVATPKRMVSDGVGTIGLDNTNRVQFELIQLGEEDETPEVLQTVTITQQAFLNSLERFSTFRQRLEEKELIRRSQE
jgi:hypothetical protein